MTKSQTQHAKVVRVTVEVSVGSDDADRTIDTFTEAIRKALQVPRVKAHNITFQGAYYILDGKVCLPDDYDPQTQDRKPGTYPPEWAGGPSAAERNKTQLSAVVEDDRPHEFVQVKPIRSRERDPKTGRRYRSDRGVKRGPREVQVQAAS